MGLSASQARLLSITARLTHNETQSQLITNAKLRLADKSAEASKDYMEALNTTKFVYMNYDNTGLRQTEDFTVGGVYQYSDIKNQYGFIDAQGRLLVSSIEADNYENSNTLAEFLSNYGISETTNPERERALDRIYGDEYNNWFNPNNPYDWLTTVNGATQGLIDQMVTMNNSGIPSFNSTLLNDQAAYDAWKQGVIDAVNGASGTTQTEGIYNSWLDELKDIPDYIEKPTPPDAPPTEPTPPNPDDYAVLENFVDAIKTGGCYSLAQSGKNCYMHVLSDMLGPGTHTTSSGETFEVTSEGSWDWNYASPSHTYNGQIDAVREIIKVTESTTTPGKTVYQKIVDFLWDTHTCYDGSATGGDSLPENKAIFDEIIDVDLAAAKNTDAWNEAVDLYNKEYEDYLEELAKWEAENDAYLEALKEWETKFAGGLETWAQNIEERENSYREALENLPPETIPNKNDPKYQWYTNIWFRMGGISDAEKEENKNNYKVLEEYYMYNANWLKFALEHGIVTMEQVEFQEEGSLYPLPDEMNNYAWASIQHGNCADMYEETDELAIVKAEVKYQQATAEIQAKDKKYDTDLKKLDTTHTALQTEYDALKSVIDKNVDRSFKAFS